MTGDPGRSNPGPSPPVPGCRATYWTGIPPAPHGSSLLDAPASARSPIRASLGECRCGWPATYCPQCALSEIDRRVRGGGKPIVVAHSLDPSASLRQVCLTSGSSQPAADDQEMCGLADVTTCPPALYVCTNDATARGDDGKLYIRSFRRSWPASAAVPWLGPSCADRTSQPACLDLIEPT